MGKVRTISPEEQELKEKEKAAKEAERLAKIEAAKAAGQKNKDKAESVKGKEEVNEGVTGAGVPHRAPVATEEAKSSDEGGERQDPEVKEQEEKKAKKVSKYAAKQKSKKRERSEKYEAAAKLIDKSKLYPVKEALGLLEKTHLAKFDETVEMHINTSQAGLSGQVTLPHGTGKNVRVAILQPAKDAAGAEALLKEIEAGKINFDILVATPDAMPKLAKVARVLGPRGLMPNPKNGTITTNPEAVAKQYAGGQMHYKTESKIPVMHVAVGKLSFGADKLSENIAAMLKAVKSENIKKVTLKSTMSPAVRLLVK